MQRKNDIPASQDQKRSEKAETDEPGKKGEQPSTGNVFAGNQTATGQTTGGGEDGNWNLAPDSGEQSVNNE